MADWTKLKRGSKRRIASWLLTWSGTAYEASARRGKQQVMLRVAQYHHNGAGKAEYQAQLMAVHHGVSTKTLCNARTPYLAMKWALQSSDGLPLSLWEALLKVAGEDAK